MDTEDTVYAVMRGTELKRLYRKKTDAQWYAGHLNERYVRGKRHVVVPVLVRENNA